METVGPKDLAEDFDIVPTTGIAEEGGLPIIVGAVAGAGGPSRDPTIYPGNM